ncbi:hypothetical protein Avbf_11850 [Armadillidium vulgare]|nr:hypothetical protein Avbf_11850 [Armadillidium vulgare]
MINSTMESLSDLSLRESPSPPGTPGKLEILQDLDLFYIKQLAHNFKEYDLEQRIALEIKMREGTNEAWRSETQRNTVKSTSHPRSSEIAPHF